MGARIAFCKKTDAVVPHKYESDPPVNTYWRVPMSCPLPDSEVFKSEVQAEREDWITVNWNAETA